MCINDNLPQNNEVELLLYSIDVSYNYVNGYTVTCVRFNRLKKTFLLLFEVCLTFKY